MMQAMMTSPPVSKEQAFLETYFQCLQKFAYDKAKELSDKEKEALKTQPVSAWSILVYNLGSLATTEKAYSSLVFLTQNLNSRFFGRKDSLQNLRTNYNCLLLELRKIEEGSKRSLPSGDQGENLEQLFGHLSGQLCQYITARIRLAEFYEQMLLMSQSKWVVFEDIQVIISEIIHDYQNSFHHPILSPVKTNFSLECDVLQHLIQAQVKLQEWQFLPCLLHLNDANTKLNSWAASAFPREQGKRMGFSSSSSSKFQSSAVFQWLTRFKALLVAKFGLYFYEVLSKHGPPNELKNQMAKTSIDFYAKIVQFQKKMDAMSVCLILDTTKKEEKEFVYLGPGYHHPENLEKTDLQGMESYPTIFSYPMEKPDRLWPSVISILTSRAGELDAYDKIVFFCDEKLPMTYYMARIEPRITLVVLFESKKSEKDSYITNFINEISSHLRCSKLFASLKPGVK